MDGGRPADDVVLGMVADQLGVAMGAPWEVRDGMVKGPGTLAVVLGADHTGRPSHVDLDFVLNVDRPHETTISDCVTGYGSTPEQVAAQAVRMWLDTTGSALLELLVQDGSHAAHYAPGDPDGLAGWHVIHGGINGWGVGDEHDAVQRWAVQHALLPPLASSLKGAFDREQLVGVKLFFGGGQGSEVAEVRVGGVCHDAASEALAELGWPRPERGFSYARTFVLLVHQDED